MAGLSTGLLKKFTISPCTINKGGTVSMGNGKFGVMINPASYPHSHSVCFNQQKTLGQVAQASKFRTVGEEILKFNITIDDLGAVNMSVQGMGFPDVKTQVQQLSGIVYNYNEENHLPNLVKSLWGSFIFYGQMKTIPFNYTLFKLEGKLLWTKVDMDFTGFMNKEEVLRANRSFPNLTREVEFKADDILPLLCNKIYRDTKYYTNVSRINNITDFRNINPGQSCFSPIKIE